MKRFYYKNLYEKIYAIGKQENLSVDVLYGLSANLGRMKTQYTDIVAALGPIFEYNKKVLALESVEGDTELELEKLKKDNIKLIESTNRFLNGEVEDVDFYKIPYHIMPDDLLCTIDDMNFLAPILKDG